MIINIIRSTIIALCAMPLALHALEKPQRIVALSPHAVELLYSIGAGDNIVATISHADYPEQAKNIEVIGDFRGITLEKLIALKPDLIVAWSGGNKLNQVAQMKKLGFNVVDSNPKSLLEIADNLRMLGKLTGHQEESETVASQFEQQLQQITDQYQGRKKIRTFYQLWSKPLMTISSGSWINQFIERCGGENVFADAQAAYPKVSVENILLTDAQVILIPDDANTQGHALFDWTRWKLLPAVKNKHIYYPNATILHRPTTRILGPMKQVCEFIDQARVSYTQAT